MMILFYLSIILFILVCTLLCFVILVQESKSMGLGASFGGEASSFFGTSTADVLKKFTAWISFIFMLSCVLLSLWTSSMGRHKKHQIAQTIESVVE